MKKLYFLLGCAALALTGNAEVTMDGANSYFISSVYKNSPLKVTAPQSPVAATRLKAPSRAAGDTYSVTFSCVVGAEGAKPAFTKLYKDGEIYRQVNYDEATEATATLEEGTYDMLTLFEVETGSKFPNQSMVWVVQEAVSVTAATTHKIKIADATEHIKLRMINVDGSAAKAPDYALNADRQYEVVNPGNVQAVLRRYVLILDGKTTILSGGGSWSGNEVAGAVSSESNDREVAQDLFITPLSDRFMVNIFAMAVTNDGKTQVMSKPLKAPRSCTVSNDPTAYKHVEVKMAHTPRYDKRTNDPAAGYELMMGTYLNGAPGALLQVTSNQASLFDIYGCIDDNGLGNYFKYYLAPDVPDHINEYVKKVEIIPGYFIDQKVSELKKIYAPEVLLSSNGEYCFMPTHTESDRYMIDTDYNEFPAYEIPSHLLTPVSQNAHTFGEGTPIFQLNYGTSWRKNVLTPDITMQCVGMGGEQRMSDIYDMLITVEQDGESKLSETLSFADWMKSINYAKATPQQIKLKAWHENILVDGNKGKVTMDVTVNYTDGYNGDINPPTLNAIQVVDAQGMQTTRVANAQGAQLLITAGDHNQKFGTPSASGTAYAVWEAAPLASINVEYAPNGSTEFSPLTAVAVAGESHRAYGSLYKCDLSEVSRSGDNKWYDLRVSLADAAGNTQVQTLTHAFKIDALLAGVDAITGDVPGFTVEGRSIAGDVDVYTTSGVRVNGTSLAPGLYIVKSATSTTKVIIR